MYIYSTVGIVLLLWIGSLVGYLSKGYFRPHQAPPSPVASSRRITFEQVPPPLTTLQEDHKRGILCES